MTAIAVERPVTRAEKVALIAETRAEHPEWTHAEIAADLGMSRSALRNLLNDPDGSKQAARRDRYKGVCERCGGETKSDGTSRPSPNCASCAIEIAHESKVWTRERVIEAIQAWAAEHGRPPLADDWLHSDPDGRWPNRGSVYRSGNHHSSPFPYWADAIEAAGFPRPDVGKFERSEYTRRLISEAHTIWTRETCVAAIRAYVAWAGEVPIASDGNKSPLLPHPQTVRKHGWPWTELVREAGFEPRLVRSGRTLFWTPDRIVAAIRAWADVHGAPPKFEQWIGPADLAYPSGSTVLKNFGRWNTAIEAAGFEPRHQHVYEARAAA